MMVSLTTSLQTQPDPVALGRTVLRLQEKGITLKEIAGRLGKSISTVAKYASLIELDSEVRNMIRSGEMGVEAGYYVSRIEDLSIQRKIARLAKDNRWDHDRVQRFVQEYLKEKEAGVPSDIAYSRTIQRKYAWLRRGTYCDRCHEPFKEGERGILIRLCEECYKRVYE